MKIKSSVLVVAALFVLTAGVAIAQMGMGKMGPGPKPGAGQGCGMCMGQGFGPELKLTQDQMAQLKQINDDFMAANSQVCAGMQAKHKELAALVAAPVLDEEAIRAKMGEIEAVRAQMQTAKTKKMIASMKVLTADQRAKMSATMKNCGGCGMGAGAGCGMMGQGKGMGAGCAMGQGQGKGQGQGAGKQGGCQMGGPAAGAKCPSCPMGK